MARTSVPRRNRTPARAARLAYALHTRKGSTVKQPSPGLLGGKQEKDRQSRAPHQRVLYPHRGFRGGPSPVAVVSCLYQVFFNAFLWKPMRGIDTPSLIIFTKLFRSNPGRASGVLLSAPGAGGGAQVRFAPGLGPWHQAHSGQGGGGWSKRAGWETAFQHTPNEIRDS